MGVDPVKYLGTGGTPKCADVGEICVGGYCLSEAVAVEPWKSGLNVPSHGEAECDHGKLHCVLQSLPDDVDWPISEIWDVLVGAVLGSGTRHIGKGIEFFICPPKFIIVEGEEESVDIMGVDGILRFQCQVKSTSHKCVTMFDVRRVEII